DPKHGGPRAQIALIISGFRAVKLNISRADVERCAVGVLHEHAPAWGLGPPYQNRDRAPREIDPRACRAPPFDNDTDRNGCESRRDVHATRSSARMGNPVIRFWGFRRNTRSASISMII